MGKILAIAEKLNLNFSACKLPTEVTVLECSLWGVSRDPALNFNAYCRGCKKDKIYAFIPSCQNWISPGVLHQFKDEIVELLSERFCFSVEAAMVSKDCSASPVRQFLKQIPEEFWGFTDLLYQTD